VLGRLPPALIGGGVALDVGRAREGLKTLAARLPGDLSVEQLANGIVEIANWDDANAIRQMTIQRGIDPGAFALLAFGGSGPAQSPAVMELMDMKTCVVPPNPGNLSAFGLLAVDWRVDHIVTRVMHQEAIDLAAIAAIYGSLEKEAGESLTKDGIAPARIVLAREADIRYAGQSMEVRVPAPPGPIDAAFIKDLADAFHAAHQKTFGYNYAGAQKVELVNFCVSGFGKIDRPRIPEIARTGTAVKTSRPVYFDGKFCDTPIFARASLPVGFAYDGPAVVEEFGSTTVIFSGQHLTVDPHGILIIKASGKTAPP